MVAHVFAEYLDHRIELPGVGIRILDARHQILHDLVFHLGFEDEVLVFFAETEQVAFCTAHVVPGIDFSNDPLLAGRIHSYVDTQITRLGGPNFHEIPINAPVAEVHNNQRDGLHRQAINRGRVAYEPNSLGGGCPFQAGGKGFVSFPAKVPEEPKLRGKPEKFADHYTQATLFYDSQSPAERTHIANAFRFELSKVQVPAIRKRVVSMLANASRELAQRVADGLGIGMPESMPRALERVAEAEVSASPALSLLARPGSTGVRRRSRSCASSTGTASPSCSSPRRVRCSTPPASRLPCRRVSRTRPAPDEPRRAGASETPNGGPRPSP